MLYLLTCNCYLCSLAVLLFGNEFNTLVEQKPGGLHSGLGSASVTRAVEEANSALRVLLSRKLILC